MDIYIEKGDEMEDTERDIQTQEEIPDNAEESKKTDISDNTDKPEKSDSKPELNGGRLAYINFIPPDPDSADFWQSDTLSKGSAAKKIIFVILLIAILLLLFSYMTILRHGKGWLGNLISGNKNIEFTLPIADTPQLDDKYINADGSYTASGVAKAALPSVVQIKVYGASPVMPSGQGSGIIISEDGYIVTNAHVVANAKYGISVQLYDKTEYSAELVGSAPQSDIAVIKIHAENLQPAQFADSDLCELGDEVVTIGSPAGYENSVTKGIISGLDRKIRAENSTSAMQCIQIDAAINPGNSGGPLFNMFGQVIGITSSKLVSSDYDNIGFAITINAAKPIIETLMADGIVPERPRVGITYYAVDEQTAERIGAVAGLYVVTIDPECNIAKTDIREGDIITELGGVRVSSEEQVSDALSEYTAGDEITVKFFRPASQDDLSEANGVYYDAEFKLNYDKTSLIPADEQK